MSTCWTDVSHIPVLLWLLIYAERIVTNLVAMGFALMLAVWTSADLSKWQGFVA